MALGLSPAISNAVLDAIRTDTPFIKLHVGDPGVAGTANPAAETTRKAVTFGAASGGSMANTVALSWPAIVGSEDATHFSVWNAATAGTFKASGTITANGYTAGDTLSVAIGAVVVTLDTAA